MSSRSPLFGAAALFSAMSALAFLFDLFSGEVGGAALPLWSVCVLGLYALEWFLLRRERTLRQLALPGAAAGIVQLSLFLWHQGGIGSPVTLLILIALWAGGYGLCFQYLFHPVAPERLTAHLDANVLLLVIALAIQTAGAREFSIPPLIAAAVLTLIALIARRSAGGRRDGAGAGLRGGAILALSIAGMGLTAIGAVLVFSGGVRTAVQALCRWLYAGGLWLWRQLCAFLAWIAALFPPMQGELPLPEAGPAISETVMEEIDPSPELLPYLLAALLLAVAAAAAVYLLRHGGLRFSLGGYRGERGVRRQRASLAALLGAALRRLLRGLRFRWQSICRRNTAPGLFHQLQCRESRRRRGRRDGETCRQFLARIAPRYPGCETELRSLADALDAWYFSGGDGWTAEDVRRVRRRLRRARRTGRASRAAEPAHTA